MRYMRSPATGKPITLRALFPKRTLLAIAVSVLVGAAIMVIGVALKVPDLQAIVTAVPFSLTVLIMVDPVGFGRRPPKDDR